MSNQMASFNGPFCRYVTDNSLIRMN